MLSLNEKISVVDSLQRASYEVFCSVAPLLRAGMSEFEISELLRLEFLRRGVGEFWYDVPIIVLVGRERFLSGANADYPTKSPSKNEYIQAGSTIYIDLHPQDNTTGLWGDWNTMAVFHPRAGIDDAQVDFLDELRKIHREGFNIIQGSWTGADIVTYYAQTYLDHGISPLLGEHPDIGHTIHSGPKKSANRLLLNPTNQHQLADQFYAIEPAGCRKDEMGEPFLVGRFEECVYIPASGKTILLGSSDLAPIAI